MIKCTKCKTILENSEVKDGKAIKTRRTIAMLYQYPFNRDTKVPFCSECGFVQSHINERHIKKLQKKQEFKEQQYAKNN